VQSPSEPNHRLESPPTFLWGTEAHCRALFREAITALQVTERAVVWRYRSPQEWLEVWRAALGNLQQAFAQLGASDQERLANDLVALLQRFNRLGIRLCWCRVPTWRSSPRSVSPTRRVQDVPGRTAIPQPFA